jgi:CubicO group peptidase (beta-lactamase class C family)
MLRFGDRGYGLGAQRLWIGGRGYPGHSGLLGRDTTLLVWVPEKQVAVAVIVNRPSSKVDDLLVYRHGDNPSLLRLAMNLAG